MRALVKYQSGPGHVELRDMPETVCGDDQLKIEVAWCGICGTDLHVLHDTFRNYPPVILGHEFSGTVVEAGKKADRSRVGERVAIFPAMAVTCGKCLYCRMGKIMFCPERRGMGHGVNGAFARYAVVKPVVLAETKGIGVDAAFECSGQPASVKNCLQAVKKLGSYTQVGICGREISVEFDQIFYKQLKVAGSVGYTAATWDRVIRILEQGKVRLGDLITHRLPLAGWRTGFDLCEQQQGLKALISPQS